MPSSTLTTSSNLMNNTTYNPNNQSLFIDFCPGISQTIDCLASGNFVYILDAFHGVSDQVPSVCEYKYFFSIIKNV